MSDQKTGFQFCKAFGTPNAHSQKNEAVSQRANSSSKNLSIVSGEPLRSFASLPTTVHRPEEGPEIRPERSRNAANLRLKITAPRCWRLPVVRLTCKSQGFINTPLLRSAAVAASVKSENNGGESAMSVAEKIHCPKKFPLTVKFSLQENESAYKVIGDDPKAKRFVETGVLLLFQGTA